jgi:hypothetical protein
VFPQRKRIDRTTMGSTDTTPEHISKGFSLGYGRATCTPMFIVALFTIAKLWKQLRCPMTDERIKKMW